MPHLVKVFDTTLIKVFNLIEMFHCFVHVLFLLKEDMFCAQVFLDSRYDFMIPKAPFERFQSMLML